MHNQQTDVAAEPTGSVSREQSSPTIIALVIDLLLIGIAVGVTWWLSESWQLCAIIGVQLLIVWLFIWRIARTTPGSWMLRSVFGIGGSGDSAETSPEALREAIESHGFSAPEAQPWHSSNAPQQAPAASIHNVPADAVERTTPVPPAAPIPTATPQHSTPAAAPAPQPLPSPVAGTAAAAREPVAFHSARDQQPIRIMPAEPVQVAPAPQAPAPTLPPSAPIPARTPAPTEPATASAEPAADIDATHHAAAEVEIPEPPSILALPDGSQVELAGTLLVGRKPRGDDGETEVTLEDEHRSISRNHLSIQSHERAVLVTDLSSANGTRLRRGTDELQLEPDSPVALLPGDELVLGRFTLRLR